MEDQHRKDLILLTAIGISIIGVGDRVTMGYPILTTKDRRVHR